MLFVKVNFTLGQNDIAVDDMGYQSDRPITFSFFVSPKQLTIDTQKY